MKKLAVMLLTGALALGTLVGCESKEEADAGAEISVVSREDGSGTRGAFVELVEIEEDDVDNTTEEAIIVNSTSVMMTTVAGDENAIGYASLGSLDDSVKAVQVNGVAPSMETVKDGSYSIARPFNIVTKGEVSEVAQDFINFIMSADGQAVVEENGYIAVSEGEFESTLPEGKLVIAGSSSVTPVMEKLKEAYLAINANAEIEIQESDSTTGMTAVTEGSCDIGMASRELKDSELEAGLTSTAIAMDGIAVIVNTNNTVESLTTEQIKSIFVGETITWDEL